MNYTTIKAASEARGLCIAAAFHPEPDDLPPEGCRTLILLAPHEPGFWARIEKEPCGENPVDDWSRREVTALANQIDAKPLFPFGGPPYQPFIRWALASGQVWQSPLGLLVHHQQGLFISFRGALAFERDIDLPTQTSTSPCLTCPDQPCKLACPVDAFAQASYDVPSCTSHLATPEGQDCLQSGCLARRACPVGQGWPRNPRQSAHHMRIFFASNR